MSEVSFQGQTVHELVSGASRVLIAPKYGARLLKWTVGEQEIIHWPENANWANGYSVAHTRGGNPILFPFIARHYAEGVLGEWRDAAGVVRELPMHGFARDMAFKVIKNEAGIGDGVLRMRLKPTTATRAMYPFKFTFDVIYELKENALQVTFETTNNSEVPLPYYAGHHFYFSIPRDERKDWEITLPCGRSGIQNKDGSVKFSPMQKTKFALDDAELIDRFHLDFSQPGVLLKHRKSNREIAIELLQENSPPWYDVTTWTQDETSDFYCVEPWLGLPNAIHSGLGLRWIESKQTETATCRIIASE